MYYNYLNGVLFLFLYEEVLLFKILVQEISGIIEWDEQKAWEVLLCWKFEQVDCLFIFGEIMAGIVYEFNMFLGNIFGFVQLIQDCIDDQQVGQDIEKIINFFMYVWEIVKKFMFFFCEMFQ